MIEIIIIIIISLLFLVSLVPIGYSMNGHPLFDSVVSQLGLTLSKDSGNYNNINCYYYYYLYVIACCRCYQVHH